MYGALPEKLTGWAGAPAVQNFHAGGFHGGHGAAAAASRGGIHGGHGAAAAASRGGKVRPALPKFVNHRRVVPHQHVYDKELKSVELACKNGHHFNRPTYRCTRFACFSMFLMLTCVVAGVCGFAALCPACYGKIIGGGAADCLSL